MISLLLLRLPGLGPRPLLPCEKKDVEGNCISAICQNKRGWHLMALFEVDLSVNVFYGVSLAINYLSEYLDRNAGKRIHSLSQIEI